MGTYLGTWDRMGRDDGMGPTDGWSRRRSWIRRNRNKDAGFDILRELGEGMGCWVCVNYLPTAPPVCLTWLWSTSSLRGLHAPLYSMACRLMFKPVFFSPCLLFSLGLGIGIRWIPDMIIHISCTKRKEVHSHPWWMKPVRSLLKAFFLVSFHLDLGIRPTTTTIILRNCPWLKRSCEQRQHGKVMQIPHNLGKWQGNDPRFFQVHTSQRRT